VGSWTFVPLATADWSKETRFMFVTSKEPAPEPAPRRGPVSDGRPSKSTHATEPVAETPVYLRLDAVAVWLVD
jgi:hypothetical protein